MTLTCLISYLSIFLPCLISLSYSILIHVLPITWPSCDAWSGPNSLKLTHFVMHTGPLTSPQSPLTICLPSSSMPRSSQPSSHPVVNAQVHPSSNNSIASPIHGDKSPLGPNINIVYPRNPTHFV
jgi:hypothetical protein